MQITNSVFNLVSNILLQDLDSEKTEECNVLQ